MASSNAAVTPFPPPPRFYEEFEPHGSKDFQCPAPPPPLEGPYVVYGVRYDTSFSPQDPAAAHRDRGLDIEVEQQSPVATLRLLNRVLPEEYLKLMQLMIDRPILCLNEADRQKIRDVDQQRERVENIIAAMHLTLSRFRPYQARQALITTLRAQVDRRRREAKDLRECRERAQSLIQRASADLKGAKDALASSQASEVSAEQALSATAAKATAASGADILSLQPQAVASAPPAPRAVEAPVPPGSAGGDGQTAEKEGRSDGAAAGAAHKRRRTADLLSHLDSISRDIPGE
eukprot:Tamp_23078.p2 GENE.Tamp_23078~~Tamp_23078.p2  ORF type:complete len:291 (-),score=72.16 Tamp_23078:180-1052(-)